MVGAVGNDAFGKEAREVRAKEAGGALPRPGWKLGRGSALARRWKG